MNSHNRLIVIQLLMAVYEITNPIRLTSLLPRALAQAKMRRALDLLASFWWRTENKMKLKI